MVRDNDSGAALLEGRRLRRHPAPRTPADILPATDDGRRDATPGPVAQNKWLVASVARDAASVVGQIFDEADRRDPDHHRTWVALVDGNNHQIDRITAQAQARTVPVTTPGR